ncbi:MAG: toprim domain-containing protein, partial [Acidobacterium ailaaui]|nr:toprim domain-containing protein [Pseudacidobacterium ailaaui]
MRAELEHFDWINATWSPDKLIAASPFRLDRTPSFFVWLRDNPTTRAKAGFWVDSGAYDAEYARGGIVKLLAFLRSETESETIEYLTQKYGLGAAEASEDDDHWRLPALTFTSRPPRKQPLPESVLPAESSTAVDYLARRGITVEVQERMGVRYDRQRRAIVMPWRLPNGALANAKYRATRGKAFWFVRGGWPIRDLVYGIDVIYRERPRLCVICEAEIDAMSAMVAGYAAVATGGVAASPEKIDALVRASVEEYVVLVDNDKAGEKLRQQLLAVLSRRKRVSIGRLPAHW